MAWNVRDRSEEFSDETSPIRNEWREQVAVFVSVFSKASRCCVQRPAYEDGRPIVERMGESGRRLDQIELELQRAEER
jgi:hypothetical protein